MNKRACAAQHFGAWACEPKWLQQALASVQAGTWKPKASMDDMNNTAEEKPYECEDGIAEIEISDQITKHESSFGGASSVSIRRALRKASKDPDVRAIMLRIDSPGGTVAGTGDLGEDIARIAKDKPVYAYIEDLGASAAYWIASQATKVFANPTAMIGSIGVYAVLQDTTGAQEKEGVRLTVVSTGEYKGLGADGKVTDKLVADVLEEINAYNEHFISAVAQGRKMKPDAVKAIADGRVFIADKAKELGLIDEVASFDVAMTAITGKVNQMNKEQVNAYLAENPEAVASITEQGKKAGMAESRSAELARAKAVREAVANDSLAWDLFLAGKDADEAKSAMELAGKLSAQHVAELAKTKAELEKVKAEAGTQGAVAVAAVTTVATDKPADDPKAIAAWEWENEKPQGFSTKERYVAVRIAELSGKLNVMKK